MILNTSVRAALRKAIALLLILLIWLCLPGCGMVRVMDESLELAKIDADTIGANLGEGLGRGLLEGVDSTRLDALVNRLATQAGNSLNEQLDSFSLQALKTELATSLRALISETTDSLDLFIQDPAKLDALDAQVNKIITNALRRVNQFTPDLITSIVNQDAELRVLLLRDSLLGPGFSQLLSAAVAGSARQLAEGKEVDSLINKIGLAVERTAGHINESTRGISKTMVTIGAVIAGLLLATMAVILLLRRQRLKQQKKLLVNMTKAIDAIPDQGVYDATVSHLRERIGQGEDSAQSQILNEVLAEYKDQYPNKNQYANYHQELVEKLRGLRASAELRDALLAGNTDDGFHDFVNQTILSPSN